MTLTSSIILSLYATTASSHARPRPHTLLPHAPRPYADLPHASYPHANRRHTSTRESHTHITSLSPDSSTHLSPTLTSPTCLLPTLSQPTVVPNPLATPFAPSSFYLCTVDHVFLPYALFTHIIRPPYLRVCFPTYPFSLALMPICLLLECPILPSDMPS